MSQMPVPASNGDVQTSSALPHDIQVIVDRAIATGRYVGANAFIMQALGAETLEEATEIGAVISGKEHVGERMRYVGVSFLDSDPELDSPVPLFALVDVVRDDGDGVVEKMSCGAGQVLGVLIRAAEKGWFPFDAQLESVSLGGGRNALNLATVPRKVTNDADF